jgi:hypothetical protein
MATAAQVATLFHSQLNNDSRAQSLAAGNGWREFPLSFFYSSEVSVDLGVKATMLRILEIEHALLAPEHWVTLAGGINRATKADDAVTFIAQVSTAAVHQNL